MIDDNIIMRKEKPGVRSVVKDIMIGTRFKRNCFSFVLTSLVLILVLDRAMERLGSDSSTRTPSSSEHRTNMQHNYGDDYHRKPPRIDLTSKTVPPILEARPVKPPAPDQRALFQMEIPHYAIKNVTVFNMINKIKDDIFNRTDSEFLTYHDYQEFTERVRRIRGANIPAKDPAKHFKEEPKCNKRRKRQIRDVCKGMENNKPFHEWSLKDIEMNNKMFSNIVVDDKHKVLFCEVPKTGCTSWKVAISLLTGRVRKKDIMSKNYLAVHAPQYMGRLGLYYLHLLNPKQIRKKLRRYYKFMVVRHPLDRIVSAYTDKFINRDPFFQWYERMKEHIKAKFRDEDADQDAGISFREFVNYAADPQRILDRHWMDYQSLCHPCVFNYDYIVKVESMEQDAQYLLPKISNDPEVSTLPEAHSHRGADQARKPYKELREFFNITKQETERLLDGPYKYDTPMFGYRFDAETGRAMCDKYTTDGQCC